MLVGLRRSLARRCANGRSAVSISGGKIAACEADRTHHCLVRCRGRIGQLCCQSEQPHTIALEDIRARPEPRAESVDDYEGALASIAAVVERDLGLPKLQGMLHLVPDREALYDVLEASGADPATARGAADKMLAIGAHRAVCVNLTAFTRLNWNARLAVLSHEVAHAAQYELSRGRRSTSDQWLREGYADWVQAHVLDSMGVLTRDGILTRNSRFISRPGSREALPPPVGAGELF